MRRSLTIPLIVAALAVAGAAAAPLCQAAGLVRVSSSAGIDKALRAAVAKGPGTTVSFGAGTYSHAAMTWPNGINLRGAGMGKTKLDFAIRFGSHSTIGGGTLSTGLTIGSSSQNTAFHMRCAAHGTRFRFVRFRSRGPVLWDLCDYTHLWRNSVDNANANVHDVSWIDCQFEYTGDANGTTFNIWWDARKGGSNVYNLTWRGCVFGVKDSSGQYGSGKMGLLIQPSPPEHASDGPRPNGVSNTDFGFDFSKVTHGSGQAAIGGAKGYGFRIWNSDFVGPASFTSFDLCDYIRAWAMVTYHLTNPADVTAAMIAAAPDRMTTKGVSLRYDWVAGKLRREIGRNVHLSHVKTEQGTDTYHVPAAVRTVDRALYGL